MKKLMFALIATSVAAVMGETIESANVVGYNTGAIESKYQVFGVNFTKADGTNYKIDDLFTYDSTKMTAAHAFSDGDQIQIADEAGSYVNYYLLDGYNGKGKNYNAEYVGKWAVQGKNVPADTEVPPGTVFWYVRKDATLGALPVTFSGAVANLGATTNLPVVAKYRLIGNPYSAPLYLNQHITVSGGTQAHAFSDGDQIQVCDSTGSYANYYLLDGYNGKGKNYNAEYVGKWASQGKNVPDADANIPVGKGAWYVRKDTTDSTFTVTLTQPYSL